MKKLMFVLVILLVASVAFAQTPAGQGKTTLNGGIVETFVNVPGAGPNPAGGPGLGRHDLLNTTTNSPLGCETCHLPHTAPTYGASFLWAWKTVPNSVATYQSDTNGGFLVTPSGRTANTRSVLCLTCHDGTSASANNVVGAFQLLNTANNESLATQHPVDALVPNNTDYATVVPISTSLSLSPDSVSANINNLPLWGSDYRVECSSCHDQHNDYTSNQGMNGGYPFLRVANTNGTLLCRQCHMQ